MVRILLVAVGVAVAAVVIGATAIDEGEVVTLITLDAEGKSHETQLWVVEVEGSLYLRSSSSHTHWLDRLRAHPDVVLLRDGQELRFRAVPLDDAGPRRAVNRAMAQKYGGTDRFYSRLFDRRRSVPIRLDRAPGPASAQADAGAAAAGS